MSPTPTTIHEEIKDETADELAHLLSDPDLNRLTRGISDAYTARADAFHKRGEYERAVKDYATALLQVVNSSPPAYETHPEAYNNRRDAILSLGCFFAAGGDPDKPGLSEWERSIIRKAHIRHGYIVTADDCILFTYSLNDEGRQEAIRHADRLAGDSDERFLLDNEYLAECDDFTTNVYSYDGHRAVKIYEAPPIDPEDPPAKVSNGLTPNPSE